jgi:hypothetical protein
LEGKCETLPPDTQNGHGQSGAQSQTSDGDDESGEGSGSDGGDEQDGADEGEGEGEESESDGGDSNDSQEQPEQPEGEDPDGEGESGEGEFGDFEEVAEQETAPQENIQDVIEAQYRESMKQARKSQFDPADNKWLKSMLRPAKLRFTKKDEKELERLRKEEEAEEEKWENMMRGHSNRANTGLTYEHSLGSGSGFGSGEFHDIPLDLSDFQHIQSDPPVHPPAGICLKDDLIAKAYNNPKSYELARMIMATVECSVGTGIYESPRIDGKKLIRGMMSEHLNIERLGREEMERKRLMIICDTSGSTSELCNFMAAAAYRVAEKDDRVVIPVHIQ